MVESKQEPYDTGKSISAYGEYGTYVEISTLVLDADSISTYTNIVTYIKVLVEKITCYISSGDFFS